MGEAQIKFHTAGPTRPHQQFFHAMLFACLVARLEGDKKTLAEIGVDEGNFANEMLSDLTGRTVPVDRYYAIDPWQTTRGYGDRRDSFLSAMQRLSVFWPIPRVLQETSDRAASLVADASLHFVFVDALHDFQSVLQDLETWWPKVCPGGILAGHDYAPEKPERFPGAVRAVQIFAHRKRT